VAPSRLRARASELQHSAEVAIEGMLHSNRVARLQRGVSEKEVLMAAKRAARQVATSTSTSTSTGRTRRLVETDADTETGRGEAKRQRVGGSCGASHEDVRVEGSDERSAMEIDCVVLPAGPSPASPPFSPVTVSPSRRPWQLRPEPPETRPDAEGKLTRVWVHVLNSTRARSPRPNAHSSRASSFSRPPVSPYGLIEEDAMVYNDPFKLLVVCQLLNKTTATVVRHVVYRDGFFDRYPDPDVLAGADTEGLEAVLKPLGLWRKRAVGLKRFAREYREAFYDAYTGVFRVDANVKIADLYGCGEYASDAWDIFVLGAWRSLRTSDKDLRRYVEFLERTDGVGVGFASS